MDYLDEQRASTVVQFQKLHVYAVVETSSLLMACYLQRDSEISRITYITILYNYVTRNYYKSRSGLNINT